MTLLCSCCCRSWADVLGHFYTTLRHCKVLSSTTPRINPSILSLHSSFLFSLPGFSLLYLPVVRHRLSQDSPIPIYPVRSDTIASTRAPQHCDIPNPLVCTYAHRPFTYYSTLPLSLHLPSQRIPPCPIDFAMVRFFFDSTARHHGDACVSLIIINVWRDLSQERMLHTGEQSYARSWYQNG